MSDDFYIRIARQRLAAEGIAADRELSRREAAGLLRAFGLPGSYNTLTTYASLTLKGVRDAEYGPPYTIPHQYWKGAVYRADLLVAWALKKRANDHRHSMRRDPESFLVRKADFSGIAFA